MFIAAESERNTARRKENAGGREEKEKSVLAERLSHMKSGML